MTHLTPALAAVAVWCAFPVRGNVIYNDGMVNDLSTRLGDNVLIEDGLPPGSSPTTLNILQGGSAHSGIRVR
jgi:hypothetical protein